VLISLTADSEALPTYLPPEP